MLSIQIIQRGLPDRAQEGHGTRRIVILALTLFVVMTSVMSLGLKYIGSEEMPIGGLNKGDTVQALYDYAGADGASDKEELKFQKGDQFTLLKPVSDDPWWHVQSKATKKKGYVPSNFVCAIGDLGMHEWCHGPINRSAAEFLLIRTELPGSFLVRESQSKPGDYTLSIFDGKVAHYRINEGSDGKFFIRQKQTFESIPDLITHHQSHTSGLPMVLSNIVPKAHAKALVISKKLEAAWELNRKDVVLGTMLGSGNYGDVHKAVFQKMTVAVKTVKEDSMGVDEFMKEAQVMKTLQHPNLVRLIGVCSTTLPMYIVTEFLPNGDLLTYMRRPEETKKLDGNLKAQLHICTQVADGMAYLEEHNCIHRDLAARNCLVGDNLEVKIADFGMGRVIDDLYTAKTGSKMPVKWSAPESLCYNAFSTKSDVWSFGILLWEVMTVGGSPYPEVESKDVLTRIEEGYRMPNPSGCPVGLHELMLQCWMMRADDRPSFSVLKSGIDSLSDDISGGGKPKADVPPPLPPPKDWRKQYEASQTEGVTRMTVQELVDLTKEIYGQASTIVRYSDGSNIGELVGTLLNSMHRLVTASSEVSRRDRTIASELKNVETLRNNITKAAASGKFSKATPEVEKLRHVIRKLNKALKGLVG